MYLYYILSTLHIFVTNLGNTGHIKVFIVHLYIWSLEKILIYDSIKSSQFS